MDADTVTLTRTEYENLVDARDHAQAMRDVVTGKLETLGDADLDACLAAPTPLAFWRQRCGLTPAALAQASGVPSQAWQQPKRGRAATSCCMPGSPARCRSVSRT